MPALVLFSPYIGRFALFRTNFHFYLAHSFYFFLIFTNFRGRISHWYLYASYHFILFCCFGRIFLKIERNIRFLSGYIPEYAILARQEIRFLQNSLRYRQRHAIFCNLSLQKPGPFPRQTAALSHTLPTPVVSFTKSDSENEPSTCESTSLLYVMSGMP